MVSSGAGGRVRKAPGERRAEILEVAARIALTEGLERITLRAVAEELGVRPGLISHYFPAAEDLVAQAFGLAISREHDELFSGEGEPLERLTRFVEVVSRSESRELSALWLNARHLSRFAPALAEAISEAESLNRERLTALIESGVRTGAFATDDSEVACMRILIAVDGFGAYVNSVSEFRSEAHQYFVADVCEWALGLRVGAMRARVGLEVL